MTEALADDNLELLCLRQLRKHRTYQFPRLILKDYMRNRDYNNNTTTPNDIEAHIFNQTR